MPDDLRTASLLDLVARYQSGDGAALDQVVRRTMDRLERLARKMLRGVPLVRSREQTDDVLQNALVRLARALRAVAPPSTADFFRLAAEQLRRELLDLARYHRRRAPVSGQLSAVTVDQPDPAVADLDRWHALHEAVERLPAKLREVFALTFYHAWTQHQIAELFGVSTRQVRRLWRNACLRLNEMLGADLPSI